MQSTLTLKRVEDNMNLVVQEPVHDICHSLQQALAPRESLVKTSSTYAAGCDDEGHSTNDSTVDDAMEIDEEMEAQILESIDDDANRVLRPSDLDEDFADSTTVTEKDGDGSLLMRQKRASICSRR